MPGKRREEEGGRTFGAHLPCDLRFRRDTIVDRRQQRGEPAPECSLLLEGPVLGSSYHAYAVDVSTRISWTNDGSDSPPISSAAARCL